MFCYRQMGILLIGLFPLLSLAQPFTIDPQSEVLYQQALPYLQQAGDKLMPCLPTRLRPMPRKSNGRWC